MNTDHHRQPHTKYKGLPPQGKAGLRLQSGSLARRDQDVKAHQRTGGKAAHSHAISEPKMTGHSGQHGEFGTIGALMTTPNR